MKRYVWISVAVLAIVGLMVSVVLVVRNHKESNHTVTIEKQEKEVVKADSVPQKNEEEVEIETEGNEVTAKKNILEDSVKTDVVRWRIKDGVLHKFAVMNMSDAIIYKSYKVINMKNDMLVMQEELHGSNKYSFIRVNE